MSEMWLAVFGPTDRIHYRANAAVVLWMLEFLRHLEQMEALGSGAQEIRQTISER